MPPSETEGIPDLSIWESPREFCAKTLGKQGRSQDFSGKGKREAGGGGGEGGCHGCVKVRVLTSLSCRFRQVLRIVFLKTAYKRRGVTSTTRSRLATPLVRAWISLKAAETAYDYTDQNAYSFKKSR